MVEQHQKYKLSHQSVQDLLSDIDNKELVIPEIQRPFVWDSGKIRDFIDSLYRGYPVGFLISWKDPEIKLKGGGSSEGKKILIDGQQRMGALMTAILGKDIVMKDYESKRIQISFHPLEEEFSVYTPIIGKDKAWIPDIGPIVSGKARPSKILRSYVTDNNILDEKVKETVEDAIGNLQQISQKQLGLMELIKNLDIELVTTIFERVNKQGVKLTVSDFVMAKLAAYGQKSEGSGLRKLIDYFAHGAKDPDFVKGIAKNDKEFAKSKYFSKISWLKNEKDDLYDPTYEDVIRVAFTAKFDRGKLGDLVALLSGRDFTTRQNLESIKKKTFEDFEEAVINVVNESDFKRFLTIIRSIGFVDKDFITTGVVNMAYTLYLKLKEQKITPGPLVKKWLVMSALTGRYSGTSETTIDKDVKNFYKGKIEKHLKQIEKSDLAENFWDVILPEKLSTSSAVSSSSEFGVFFAAMITNNEKGFLSKTTGVKNLVEATGQLHHLYPKQYLMLAGKSKKQYNQLCNFAYTQEEINIKIGSKSPKEYMTAVVDQCNGKKDAKLGVEIHDSETLYENLEQNCIPKSIIQGTVDNYSEFLNERKKTIAEKINIFYRSL